LAMVRLAIPTVEVVAPDGTKSLWVVALPHGEAVAAVRSVIPSDHTAELSIRSLRSSPRLERLRLGEVRKMEPTAHSKRSMSGPNQWAISIIDVGAKRERPDHPRTRSVYQAYAVGSDGNFAGFKLMICRHDDEAVVKAKRLIDDYDIEVWNGDRFVIRLVHRPK
jgi:hypothetical protein